VEENISMEQTPQSQLKLLIQKGKEQGYLTFAEVNDHLPQDIIDSEQVEDIIGMINDMGIQVVENAPDADELMMQETTTDEDAAEAAAAALATVEKEIGRTTDPVRMYMREMGTVELLTREGEIDIAKRIEDGINQVQVSVAEYPEAINHLLEQWDSYLAEDVRLSDIISGFYDPDADDSMISATHIGSELSQEELDDEDSDLEEDDDDDSEEEGDTGPDPEEARENFEKLRDLYNNARTIFEEKGRSHPDAVAIIAEIGEHFRTFKLMPKQFDRMVKNMRDMMDRIRVQERIIMKQVVQIAKMPKKTFVKNFANNETDLAWLDKEIAAGELYSNNLQKLNLKLNVVSTSFAIWKKAQVLTLSALKISTVVCQSVKQKLAARKKKWLKQTYVL
jgi:RNA polymerase primary sigma factor